MNILDASEIIIKNLQLNKEFIGAITVIVLFFMEFNKKIKFNPISAGLNWILKDAVKQNEILLSKIEELETKLDNHIQDSIEKDMRDRRLAILDYANSVLNGRNHTKEQYIYMMKVCDKYEMDCSSRNIINSVADESIKVIRESYSDKLQNNDFL